jgi:glycosidase
MEFHISRAIREKLQIDGLLFSYTGNVVFANVASSRRLASRLNELRGSDGDPSRLVNAGALFAMGMIDELNHALVARYRQDIDPTLLVDALRWFEGQITPAGLKKLLRAFVTKFPSVDVFQGKLTPQQWLEGTSDGLSHREAALEEMMLLWLSNINPAFTTFKELFDDAELKSGTPYKSVTASLPDFLSTRPPVAPELGSLYEALSAPMLAAPDSITGQLEYIRENWPRHLGPELKRVLLAIDVLREEDIAIWMRFHPPGADRHRHAAPGFSGEGFVGDEFVGWDDYLGGEFIVGADGVRRRRYDKDYRAPLNEYEAFSADQAWMPNVVLMAKSTYVWLEQLSKKYGRHIHRLDHIPDEELELLATRGITGLWLIGLWERSIASRTIKRLRGQTDAVASAYSLKEYNIAEDLGGAAAYTHLRDRASAYGLRLASDMVPNHMGIDSPWVIEHPDWFVSRPESPFPVYQFDGPDISPDSRVEIKIEDHYYDQTDAAVAFRLRTHSTGETRYIYHGNDGTSFAWNDTAQLDYSKAYVREHVIQVILHVARQFPIIRFDAAMVLAKQNVQRLWFPLPGTGGSIPSRAEDAMSQEQFDALMPHEFWREVVDRVAVEVPGTLLLAEAFWLLESYFVRTLGMHRVYNSAFMNMLRDEENAKYRSYLKKTIEFDPDILKRYVNFMSNPDERTAIDQFGSADKFFGVSILLSTLPGLPMFGHGQIEGYGERYGMEYKQAKMDEWPNEGLVLQHQRLLAPLLKRRYIFAESEHFVLYDFWHEHGGVDENVFAYSNRMNDQRSLIFYNNRYEGTRGSIHISAASMNKANGALQQRSLTEGLAIHTDDSVIVAYRDVANGLEYLRRATTLRDRGFWLELRGYQYVVLLDWRQLYSTAEQPWDRLCDALDGKGVHSVEESLLMVRLRPLHETIRKVLSEPNIRLFADLANVVEAAPKNDVTKTGLSEAQTVESTATPVTPVPQAPPSPQPAAEKGEPGHLDARLQPHLDLCLLAFHRVLESLPEETLSANQSRMRASESEQPLLIVSAMGENAPNLENQFKAACELSTLAALRLPKLSRQFSPAWPQEVRHILPADDPGKELQRTWAPVLAWTLLSSLPVDESRIEIFDKLKLRTALAEAFSSLGMEGEDTWRAAARVRLLLLQLDRPSANLHSQELWNNGDVHWLAGVNQSAGKTYVNKEQVEELLCWLQLPALLATSGEDSEEKLSKIESDLLSINSALSKAGYELDIFLENGKQLDSTSTASDPKESSSASPARLVDQKEKAAEASSSKPIDPKKVETSSPSKV